VVRYLGDMTRIQETIFALLSGNVCLFVCLAALSSSSLLVLERIPVMVAWEA